MSENKTHLPNLLFEIGGVFYLCLCARESQSLQWHLQILREPEKEYLTFYEIGFKAVHSCNKFLVCSLLALSLDIW